METEGRRQPADISIAELQPGDYSLRHDGILWVRVPNGLMARIDDRWTVTVEDDDTITVGPTVNGGAYSIQIVQGDEGWHGFLERGVWREA